MMEAIRAKLEELAELDSALELWGADEHEYQLEPPLSEKEIREAEHQFHIQLPPEYRAFLSTLGSGGAGPGEGLTPLVKSGRLWEWDGGDEDDLSHPFRFTSAWNLAEEVEWASPPPEDSDGYDDWVQRFEDANFEPTTTDGAIDLGEAEDGSRHLLVVSGPERGNMWRDARVNWAGLEPLVADGGGRLSFSAWYESWLDGAIARCRENNL